MLASVAVAVRVAYVHYQIQPLPSREEIAKAEQDAARHLNAELSRDLPSLKDLPTMKPMKLDQALILERIGELVPGSGPRAEKAWHPPNNMCSSQFPPEMDFRVEYAHEKGDPRTVVVEVQQFPSEAWPLYFAKWSPMPHVLSIERDLVLKRVSKFNHQVVVDTQFRFPDESGKLWYFWPSGKTLVSVTYGSRVVEEELLRRYLEKYPSSLK